MSDCIATWRSDRTNKCRAQSEVDGREDRDEIVVRLFSYKLSCHTYTPSDQMQELKTRGRSALRHFRENDRRFLGKLSTLDGWLRRCRIQGLGGERCQIIVSRRSSLEGVSGE